MLTFRQLAKHKYWALMMFVCSVCFFGPTTITLAVGSPEAPEFVGGADSSGLTNSGTSATSFTNPFNLGGRGLAVAGNYLYVVMEASSTPCSNIAGGNGCELKVFDISDPTNPTFVGGADASGTTNGGTGSTDFLSVFISGNYAYVTKSANSTNCSTASNKIGCELQVYDISTPSTPTFVGGADASGATNSGTGLKTFSSVFVSGSYAYVTSHTDSTDCSIADNKIGCELKVFDISDPANPTFVGGADASGATNSGVIASTFNDVLVSGNYAYVAKAFFDADCSVAIQACELHVYDISTPSTPTFVGGVDASGTINSGTGAGIFRSIAISGDYAYVVGNSNTTNCSTAGNKIGCELHVYDISTPSTPTFVGGADISGGTNTGTNSKFFYGIFVLGNYAYAITSGENYNCSTVDNKRGCELQVYDISTPSTPTFVGGVDASGVANSGVEQDSLHSIYVVDDYVYIGKKGNATDCATVGNKVGCELQVYSVDTTPPTVSLTAPADSATVSGTSVTVSANASDANGVVGVSFYVDGTLIGSEDTSSPYAVTWDTTATSSGSKTIEAVARDTAGNYATSTSRTVTLDNIPTPTSIEATTTATTATITWTTPHEGSSRVFFGIASSSASSTTELNTGGEATTTHSVTLSGLSSCATYVYRVVSRSPGGLDAATSTENSFTTSQCTGSASIEDQETDTFSSTTGGSVALDTISLSVPQLFSSASSVTFQILALDASTFSASAGTPNSRLRVSSIYHLSAFDGELQTLINFDVPLTITFSYESAEVDGLNADTLRIYRFNGSTWNVLDICSHNKLSMTVSCETSSFSEFGLFGEETTDATTQVSISARGEVLKLIDSGLYQKALEQIQTRLHSWSISDLQQILARFRIHLERLTVQKVDDVPKFTQNLGLGSEGPDVLLLQQFLNTHGFIIAEQGPGSPGNETTYYGVLTSAAVTKLQEAYRDRILVPLNLSEGTGQFFDRTRVVANELLWR